MTVEVQRGEVVGIIEALRSAECVFVHTGHRGHEGVKVERAGSVMDCRGRALVRG